MRVPWWLPAVAWITSFAALFFLGLGMLLGVGPSVIPRLVASAGCISLAGVLFIELVWYTGHLVPRALEGAAYDTISVVTCDEELYRAIREVIHADYSNDAQVEWARCESNTDCSTSQCVIMCCDSGCHPNTDQGESSKRAGRLGRHLAHQLRHMDRLKRSWNAQQPSTAAAAPPRKLVVMVDVTAFGSVGGSHYHAGEMAGLRGAADSLRIELSGVNCNVTVASISSKKILASSTPEATELMRSMARVDDKKVHAQLLINAALCKEPVYLMTTTARLAVGSGLTWRRAMRRTQQRQSRAVMDWIRNSRPTKKDD